jgi:hypothetical protein
MLNEPETNHNGGKSDMEGEFYDRAEAIRERLIQLRDSL